MAANNQESSDDRIRSLEGRYIVLLEERIKELEAVVENRKGATAEAKAVRSDSTRLVSLTGAPKDALTTMNKAASGTTRANDNAKERNPGDMSITKDKTASDMAIADQPSKSIFTGPHRLIRVRDRIQSKNGDVKELDGDVSRPLFPQQKPTPTDKTSFADLTGQVPAPQVTWLRILSERDGYKSSEFTIHADELRVLLSVALENCPGLHLAPHSPIKFESPFVPLIHNWNRLTELAADYLDSDKGSPEIAGFRSRFAKATDFDQAKEQLKLLLSKLRQTPELNAYLASLDTQKNEKTIQFDHLWTIFPPGEVVYSTVFMDEPQLFVVKEGGPEPLKEKIRNNKDLNRTLDKLMDGFETQLLDSFNIDEPKAPRLQSKLTWSMVAWTYDWNGTSFQRVPVRFTFDTFTGNRAISTLHCHPLRFHEGKHMGAGDGTDSSTATLKEMLLDRGRRFKEVCVKEKGFQMFDYDGDAISHGIGFQNPRFPDVWDRSKDQGKTRHIRGRVMVDFRAYLQYVPSPGRFGPMGTAEISNDDACSCPTCSENGALSDTQRTHYDGATADSMFDNLQYMICPPRVLGYHLESRTWLELNLGNRKGSLNHSTKSESCLTDIVQLKSDVAFGRLQLYKTQKDLIRDLVRNHSSGTNSKPWVEDIVKNKGKGLVILLHGPPGVGKTLTAESVAQLAGKPLFSVGVSDVGLKPETVERNLEVLFELAANWRAVLLFDEADVFLESRGSHTSDLNRNALVSVLLRVLEYYNGILILTTNRIREFDVAVQSRINLGIKYADLERAQLQKIFDNFLDQVPEENIKEKEAIKMWFREDDEAREWTKALNGRHIRNIIFSAIDLAKVDGGRLTLDHIKKMTRTTHAFYDGVKVIVQTARERAEAGYRAH